MQLLCEHLVCWLAWRLHWTVPVNVANDIVIERSLGACCPALVAVAGRYALKGGPACKVFGIIIVVRVAATLQNPVLLV